MKKLNTIMNSGKFLRIFLFFSLEKNAIMADNYRKRLDKFVHKQIEQPYKINNDKLLDVSHDKYYKFKTSLQVSADPGYDPNLEKN